MFNIKGSWDIITYHHSFEHIDDPIDNLKKISELLSSNGICIIRIPTVSCYAWEKYKTNWFQIDAPCLFFLHSINSIMYMLDLVGLTLEKTWYDSTYRQFLISEQYANDIPLFPSNKKNLKGYLGNRIKKCNTEN